LTDSGRRTHKVVKQPSISQAQDKESLPASTDVLTTMLRNHYCVKHWCSRVLHYAVIICMRLLIFASSVQH